MMSAAEREALFQGFIDWADDLHARGLYRGSDPLRPHAEGRTVRRRGETTVIDGPFAESHESVNGYICVEVETVEEAAALATECPALSLGWAVSVREVVPVRKPAF